MPGVERERQDLMMEITTRLEGRLHLRAQLSAFSHGVKDVYSTVFFHSGVPFVFFLSNPIFFIKNKYVVNDYF